MLVRGLPPLNGHFTIAGGRGRENLISDCFYHSFFAFRGPFEFLFSGSKIRQHVGTRLVGVTNYSCISRSI